MKRTFLVILMTGIIITTNTLAESHCDQYCAEGVICDCTWDEATNTLTINSGNFVRGDARGPFYRADYNINIAGSGVNFDVNAFSYSTGKITYSGSNATFQNCAFCDAQGDIVFTGSNASFSGQHAFGWNKGDIFLSPGSISHLDYRGAYDFLDRKKGSMIICTSEPTACANMFSTIATSCYLKNSDKFTSYTGYLDTKAASIVGGDLCLTETGCKKLIEMSLEGTVCATVESCSQYAKDHSLSLGDVVLQEDGSYSIVDANGNVIGFKSKRIYTVEEATKLSKPTGNTIKLRYK